MYDLRILIQFGNIISGITRCQSNSRNMSRAPNMFFRKPCTLSWASDSFFMVLKWAAILVIGLFTVD